MEAAHMTFEEEVIRLRSENRYLRIDTSRLKRQNSILTEKVIRLEKENLLLRKENNLLKQQQLLLVEKQKQLEKQLESMSLIVEELRRMIFGKKKTTGGKDKNGSGEDETIDGQTKKRKSANRSNTSYRRVVPKEDEVTETIPYPLTHCPDCGTLLIRLKQITRYIEDIADLVNLSKLLKRIEKHIIDSGYCPNCKKRKIATSVAPQVSVLGENVKQFICYLSLVMRLSFEQVRCFLTDTVGIALSDGEITACLDEQAEKLIPEKDRLFAKIRGAPGRHYDETGWKVQKEGLGNYCWITRPTEGEETIFLMGRSRGKGNAEELQGDIDNQVGISDDYAVYDNLFKDHQLCMAHPKRKLRDLTQTETLSLTRQTACAAVYKSFSNLYTDLERTLATDFQKDAWLAKREEYIRRLRAIAVLRKNDPEKLKAIKQ